MIWIVTGNFLIACALIAAVGAGVALLMLARQDGSGLGKIMGTLMCAAAIFIALYVVLGNHWL